MWTESNSKISLITNCIAQLRTALNFILHSIVILTMHTHITQSHWPLVCPLSPSWELCTYTSPTPVPSCAFLPKSLLPFRPALWIRHTRPGGRCRVREREIVASNDEVAYKNGCSEELNWWCLKWLNWIWRHDAVLRVVTVSYAKHYHKISRR